MSHRFKTKLKQLLKHSQTRCRLCGSPEIMFGKKSGMCKNCRNTMPKPRVGWRNADGEIVKLHLYACKVCERKYGDSDRLTRDDCPYCGSKDRVLVDSW